MQTAKKPAVIIFLVTIVSFSPGFGQDTVASDDGAELNALLEAMRQAQYPAHNMRIALVYETAQPVRMYLNPDRAKIPKQAFQDKNHYTVTISGQNSRVEAHKEMYETLQSPEPYDIRDVTTVFDGTKLLQLTNPIKGELATPKGFQKISSNNSGSIADILFDWPIDLINPSLRHKYKYELADSPNPGIHFLDVTQPNGIRYRLTVDADRGYNVTMLECFVKNNRLDYEVQTSLKKYADGIWFPSEHEKIRHPREGDRFVEHTTKVSNVEFNINVPADAFKLEFPPGTKVWDHVMREWFVVGPPEVPFTDPGSDDIPAQPKSGDDSPPTLPQSGSFDQAALSDTSQLPTENEQLQTPPLAESTTGRNRLPWTLIIVAVLVVFGFFIYLARARKAR